MLILLLNATHLPTNDIWIAATALQHDLMLFSYDRDFQFIDGLMVGRCLADFNQ